MSFADRRGAVGSFVHWLDTGPRRYGFALVAATAAAALRYGLGVAAGSIPPFILFYPTIMLLGLLCGFGPGVFATLLSAGITEYFLIEPVHSFAPGKSATVPSKVTEALSLAEMAQGFARVAELAFFSRARSVQSSGNRSMP